MKRKIGTFSIALFATAAAMMAGMPSRSFAHGAERASSRADAKSEPNVTPIFERELPNVPGRSLLAVEVVYPPGGASPPHRHPPSSFIFAYVVSGAIVSAVDDEQPRVYRAGESFYEAPGAHHRISRNASRSKPAKLLAVFVKDVGKADLVLPDTK